MEGGQGKSIMEKRDPALKLGVEGHSSKRKMMDAALARTKMADKGLFT